MSEVSNGHDVADVLRTAQSIIQSRAALSAHLGKAFGGVRDYYDILGYKLNLQPLDWIAKYDRQDIASRIVNAYPDDTWRISPLVWENQDEIDTEFEVAWTRLVERLRIYHYFHRLDRLAGLGRYAIMIMGVADGKSLADPINRTVAPALQYLSLYSEEHADIQAIDENTNSPRFGLPLTYKVDLSRSTTVVGSTQSTRENKQKDNQIVHFERVIHFADGVLEDDVYGTPRLRPVYNLLDDLQKVVGGSAEVFWRNASRDLIAAVRDGAHLTPESSTAISEHIDEFIHGLRRVLRVEGVDINALPAEIASPRDTVDVIMDMVSGTTGIPKRILLGSERGELASSQDEGNWVSRIEQRQIQVINDVILRNFIDRMISIRILPTPPDGYTIEWPPLITEDPKERTERIERLANALATIAGPGQVLSVFPLPEVRETVLEWDAESPFETDESLAAIEEEDDDDFEVDDDVAE